MTKQERDRQMRNPGNWTFEEAGGRTNARAPRAVISVAFSREDIEKIEKQARMHGLKVSQFIRNAALARAERATSGSRASFTGVGGGGQVIAYFEPTPASSAAASVEREEPSSAA